MIITMANYKIALPNGLHNQFLQMAGRETGQAIIYKDRKLRFAHINEY